MRSARLYICTFTVLLATTCIGQDIFHKSTTDTFAFDITICKFPSQFTRGARQLSRAALPISAPSKRALLSAKGELGYQYFNRSGSSDDLLLINASSNIATLRLDLVYKETYPFTLALRYNQSNPFQLDNQYEVNIGFDEQRFKRSLQEKISKKMEADFLKENEKLYKRYEQSFRMYEKQKQLLESPVYIQQAIEQKLRAAIPTAAANSIPGSISKPTIPQLPGADNLLDKIPQLPSIADPGELKKALMDSAVARVRQSVNNPQGKLLRTKDSLLTVLKNMEDSLIDAKQKLAGRLDSLGKDISELNTTDQINDYARKKGLKDSLQQNKMAGILMKTNIRAGKFLLNNSELTVTNIFLHGASIRYGSERFIQISGGMYDYAFRQVFNFRHDSLTKPKQHVLAVKLGKTDGRNLNAITFYAGKKIKAGSVRDELKTVAGVSLEKKIFFSQNLSAEFELAKSTTRQNSLSDKSQGVIKDIFTTFNTKTLGMYGAARAYLPRTKTDAEISYRYWGQQFESFNATQFFNPQNSLQGKIGQSLFQRKLHLTAGAKYTDFRTTGIASNLKTKTVFASMSAVLRLKKLPVLSVGYYPGSQLYWMDQSKLYEYFYYILNTTVSHYFMAGKIPMQATASYNRFLNKYSDSLVKGTQSYYNIFWTAWKGRFSYTMNYSKQITAVNLINTIEAGLSYGDKIVRIGGSAKWNWGNELLKLGYSFTGGLSLGRVGIVNLIFDRSFLPGRDGAFIPVSMGQVQFIKPLNFTVWR